MNQNTRILALVCTLGAVVLLISAVLVSPAAGEAPEADAQVSAERVTLSEQSELYQTLTYTRCEHTVTRRLTAPVELYGLDLEGTAALYPEWRVTEFSPVLVKMERRLEMFCPDHLVLMPDSAGYLCIYENRYGDAMALVNELETPLSSLPSAAQEEARHGLGFSTPEELEAWLESVES